MIRVVVVGAGVVGGGSICRVRGAVSVRAGAVVSVRSLCDRRRGGMWGPGRGSAGSCRSRNVVGFRVIIGVSVSRLVSAGIVWT